MSSFVLFSALVLSSLHLDFEAPDPYLGWGFGVHETKREGTDKKNQQMWRLGMPLTFAHEDIDDLGRIEFLLLPEFSYHPEYIQLVLAAGPEQEINLGPRHRPFILMVGAQFGLFYSFLLDKKNFGEESGSGMSLIDRQGLGAVGNFYIGPHWGVFSGNSIGLNFATQLVAGKVSRHTIQTTFSRRLGWSAGVNLQFRFRDVYD